MGRKSAKYGLQEIQEATRMADERDLPEIEAKAAAIVQQDSLFTWAVAAILAGSFWIIQTDIIPWPPRVPGEVGARAWASLGMLLLLYVVLAVRHERIRFAMTVVIAHGLRRQRDKDSADAA